MSDKEQTPQDERIDPALDVPANANTEKHVNYPAVEDEADRQEKVQNSPRREAWEEGLRDGREAAEPHRSGQADGNAPGEGTAGIP